MQSVKDIKRRSKQKLGGLKNTFKKKKNWLEQDLLKLVFESG